MPPEGLACLRRLRRPLAASFVCSCVGLGIQFFVLSKAWVLLLVVGGVSPDCGRLHDWLLIYCIALTVTVCCQPFAAFAMVLFGWVGIHVRTDVGEICRKGSPTLFGFVDEVWYRSWLSLVLLWAGMWCSWCVRHKVLLLLQTYAFAGPVTPEVLAQILVEEPVQPEAECSICLEGEEEEEMQRWRALRCGHAFHERCLLEWLQRARRCPLCRLDLQLEYRGPQHAEAVAAGQMRSHPLSIGAAL